VFADVWLTSLACGLVLTNQVHKWAHLPRVPQPVVWLQRAGLILSPQRHARHHASPDGRAFCVTTGWLNPVIDRAGIFTGLERLAAFVKRLFVPGAAA